jgi:hypothetical protein
MLYLESSLSIGNLSCDFSVRPEDKRQWGPMHHHHNVCLSHLAGSQAHESLFRAKEAAVGAVVEHIVVEFHRNDQVDFLAPVVGSNHQKCARWHSPDRRHPVEEGLQDVFRVSGVFVAVSVLAMADIIDLASSTSATPIRLLILSSCSMRLSLLPRHVCVKTGVTSTIGSSYMRCKWRTIGSSVKSNLKSGVSRSEVWVRHFYRYIYLVAKFHMCDLISAT